MTKQATFPAAAVAALAGVIGSIPGCQLTQLSGVDRSGRKDPRPLVAAYVTGRSPTLHTVTMEWQTVLPVEWTRIRIEGDAEGFASWLAHAFRAKIDGQRARAAAGVAIGEPFPLQSTYDWNSRFDHLHVDRGALALTLDAEHRNVRDIIAGHLKQLHYSVSKYRGGDVLENQGERGEESGGMRTIRVSANRKGEVTMYGTHLQVRRPATAPLIPVTIMAALPGNRLGDLVSVHPAVDGRKVVDCGTGEAFGSPTLWFDLAPDPFALDLLPRQAIGRNVARDVTSEHARRSLAVLLEGAPS